jgi:hypothetical protein
MFEDSYLDSFMESHIGGWTGDENAFSDAREQEQYWSEEEGQYDEDEADFDEDEYDGQPDEYTEWQDVYGGDDWDHGQYDEY